MLRPICLAFLYLILLPFTIQSPVKAGVDEETAVRRRKLLEAGASRHIDFWPITVLTYAATNQKRHYTEQPTYTTMPSPVITSPPGGALTTEGSLSTSITGPPPIPTKTGLKNCNVQGTPSSLLNHNIWGSKHASDKLACQSRCMDVSRCHAYAYQEPITQDSQNCVLYDTFIDGTTKVIPSSTSGIYFSDKYPSDGSNFCYGDSEL